MTETGFEQLVGRFPGYYICEWSEKINMNHPQIHIVLLLAIVVLVLGASNGRAQPRPKPPMIDKEPDIRAKLIALQGRLWTWPSAAAPPAGAPLKIVILGDDSFQLDQRLAVHKNVRVMRLANIDAITSCHILVVSQAGDLAGALKKAQGKSVLVIAQDTGSAQKGAVVNLPVIQNKVKMEINMSAAKKAGLTPNPGLLRIAKIIQ